MGRTRTATATAVLVCAIASTGCSPAAPPASSPAPTPAASPSETAQERQERLDYAAAEKSYRTFRAEYERVLRAGGAQRPTRVMKETAGGDYLDTFAAVSRGFKKLGTRATGSEKIVYVRHGGYSAESLVLQVCEDSRSLRLRRPSGKDSRGEILKLDLTVKRVGKSWKVWDGTGREASSCN